MPEPDQNVKYQTSAAIRKTINEAVQGAVMAGGFTLSEVETMLNKIDALTAERDRYRAALGMLVGDADGHIRRLETIGVLPTLRPAPADSEVQP